MKIIICGDIHAGKSTLIQRIVRHMDAEPMGYITKRVECPDGVSRVFIHDLRKPDDKKIIITIKDGVYEGHPELLDTFGVSCLEGIPEGSTVILDEIGTLETKAPEFQKAVLRVLSGNYTVLASAKAQNTDFLRTVRRHPDCELYIITPENRDRLYDQIISEYDI